MIRAKITYHCFHCKSENIVRNGHDPKGKQQYRCKNCGRGGVVNRKVPYTKAEKERIINAYYERPSMRGIECVFGVARQTLAVWAKKATHAPDIQDTLAPAQPTDVLAPSRSVTCADWVEKSWPSSGIVARDGRRRNVRFALLC